MTPHALEWTPERIRAFWDHYTSDPSRPYFSDAYGRSLIAYVRRRISIGIPLDYGCGAGHLLAYLAERCPEVHGIEQSPESQAAAKARIGPRANITAEVEAESADTAFLVEVVEHMDDASLDAALAIIHSALKPGGHLVITTPNAENLRASEVICAECGATFHLMQHVRSWNAETLSRYLEKQGFRPVRAEGTILSVYSGIKDWLWRSIKLAMGARPNLVVIVRKSLAKYPAR